MAGPAVTRFPHPQDPDEALAILVDGNRRYRSGERALRDHSPVEDAATGQAPFAAILGCADSRVSPSLIFDVDRGNLFTSRVAGNSVDEGTLGSTEFAVKVLGVKLVMVLGHTDCGAVKSAISAVEGSETYPPEEYGAIGPVVNRIVPAIEALPQDDRGLDECVRANARAQTATLAARGPIIDEAIAAGRLRVVPAVYEISNGGVTVL